MDNLHKLSGIEIHHLFLQRKVSATLIANTYLTRCKKYNDQLGAFLAIYEEDMLKKAKDLDEKLSQGKKVGKLAGIPIAIKDNIHIKGKITTCGSKFLENYIAPFDATVTRLIEKEDGLIIGKTNLDEFAMGSTNENSAFYPAKNPWNTKCTPGGSSGGSAAAVSARLCCIALGSDTGGSIRQPAAFTGTFGFKPTYGRVSRHGLVAFGSSLDQIGPMANSVQDIALMMEVIGTPCEKDATSYDLPSESYVNALVDNLDGATVGVPFNFLKNLEKKSKEDFEKNLEILKNLGASIIEVDLNILEYSISTYYVLAAAEASTNLSRFDGIRYGKRSSKAQTLDQVYDYSRNEGFGEEVKTRILLGTYVLSEGHQKQLYMKAQQVRQMAINSFEKAFENCLLIAMPTTPSLPFESGSIQSPVELYYQDLFTIGANLAGLPAISIPSNLREKKPVSLQLLGPQLLDVSVLQAANAFAKKCSFSPKIPPLFEMEAVL